MSSPFSDARSASADAASAHPENQLLYASADGMCIQCLTRPIKHVDSPRADGRKRCYAFCGTLCAIGYAIDVVNTINEDFCFNCEAWLGDDGKCPECSCAPDVILPCDEDDGKDGEK